MGDWLISSKPATPPPKKSKFDILWNIISEFFKKIVIFAFWVGVVLGIMKIGAHFPDITNWLNRIVANGIPFIGGGTAGSSGIRLESYGILVTTTSDAASAREVVDRLKRIGSYRANATVMSDGNKFAVVISGLASRQNAETALQRIRNTGFARARLILPEFD